MKNKKPTFLQWLRRQGACGSGRDFAKKQGRLVGVCSFAQGDHLVWLAIKLGNPQLEEIANEIINLHKRYQTLLLATKLPWRDGADAEWRTR